MTTLTKSQVKGLEISLCHLYSNNVAAAKRVLGSLLRSSLKDDQRDELLERFNASARLQQITLWSQGAE